MGVGAMVGLVAGGVVLVILLVAGGLWWYMSSAKAAKEERDLQLIVEKQSQARQSIQKTVKMIQEDYADFHKLVLQSDAVISQTVHEVKKAVPEELKEMADEILSPPPLPVIAAAIAEANGTASTAGAVPPPAAEEKPAETNATETASAEKKDEAKKSDEKKDDGKKGEAKPPEEPKEPADKKPADKKSDEKKPADKKA